MNRWPGGEPHILLVEDNPGDVDLIAEAMQRFEPRPKLSVARDGVEALAFLTQCMTQGPPPDLILLDLNLPKMDGRQVLGRIKSDEALKQIPVLVFTSSAAERDLLQAYRLHANSYITKPSDIDRFFAVFREIERFWMGTATLPPRLS